MRGKRTAARGAKRLPEEALGGICDMSALLGFLAGMLRANPGSGSLTSGAVDRLSQQRKRTLS
jgi:hypothetical protein